MQAEDVQTAEEYDARTAREPSRGAERDDYAPCESAVQSVVKAGGRSIAGSGSTH